MRAKSGKWSDLVVVVLLVLLLGTATIAQINRAQETANRVKCASNLRQMGQAILLYSNDNRGAYPRTNADANNPTPTWGTPYEGNDKLKALPTEKVNVFDGKKSEVAVKPNDVTAGLFLLLRTQDITSSVFICPSTGLEPFRYGGGNNAPLNWTNWPGKKALASHLSYSMQNPYVTKDAIQKGFKWNNTQGAEFAIAGEMNPGTDALLTLTMVSPVAEMKKGNSPNHDFQGQSILYGDGHVAWESNPFVGVNRDNIYTYGKSGIVAKDKGGDGIVGSSVGAEDSVLLPTAKDLDILDAAGEFTAAALKQREKALDAMRPVTAAQQDALRQKMQGAYKRQGGGNATMTISADKVQITGEKPATFAYKYGGIDKAKAIMNLMDPAKPDVLKAIAMIAVQPDGTISISGPNEMNGMWKRQP